jgi:hypothetical protein
MTPHELTAGALLVAWLANATSRALAGAARDLRARLSHQETPVITLTPDQATHAVEALYVAAGARDRDNRRLAANWRAIAAAIETAIDDTPPTTTPAPVDEEAQTRAWLEAIANALVWTDAVTYPVHGIPAPVRDLIRERLAEEDGRQIVLTETGLYRLHPPQRDNGPYIRDGAPLTPKPATADGARTIATRLETY